MHIIRHLLAQRHLAVLLCAATLLLKLIVPTGYMIDNGQGRITITLCSGVASRPMVMAMPGMHGNMPDHGKSRDHGKAEMPCAFSGLSAPMLGAVDPIQLAAMIAFVIAVGLAGIVIQAPSRLAHLRPPSRGPPTHL